VRNHDDKIKDMARSVLPSTARRAARAGRARIHRAERARLREELHRVGSHIDPHDDQGDLTGGDRAAIAEMVWDRRAHDKVAPLLRWAERTVARDPLLAAAYATPRDHSLPAAAYPLGVPWPATPVKKSRRSRGDAGDLDLYGLCFLAAIVLGGIGVISAMPVWFVVAGGVGAVMLVGRWLSDMGSRSRKPEGEGHDGLSR
jgi:hypothetical protein